MRSCGYLVAVELTWPRQLLRIRPGFFDFEPDLGLKLGQTKPNISKLDVPYSVSDVLCRPGGTSTGTPTAKMSNTERGTRNG